MRKWKSEERNKYIYGWPSDFPRFYRLDGRWNGSREREQVVGIPVSFKVWSKREEEGRREKERRRERGERERDTAVRSKASRGSRAIELVT